MDGLNLIFHWLLPLSLALGGFFILLRLLHRGYERVDVDLIWKVIVDIGLFGGVIMGIIYGLYSMGAFAIIKQYWGKFVAWSANMSIVHTILSYISLFLASAIQFVNYWFPIYWRAFVIIWVICAVIQTISLYWRVHFKRGANIILSTVVLSPWLMLKYLFGYQTPFFDFVQARLYVAKMKENLNDSYFDALQGYDDKGNKFENGAGGSEHTQRLKATALAVRRTHAFIKTAGGTRHAELVTLQSREIDTDRLIETSLKGLGKRLSASSIRFQDDPILDVGRGGFIFDSDVAYDPGDELGSFLGIFSNPFDVENKVSAGGAGAAKTFWNDIVGLFKYIIHFTPTAVYSKIINAASRHFSKDTSTEKAKYIAEQNLDLGVVPVPVDPDTHNDIATQRELAKKTANARIEDVTNALTAYKLDGTFNNVVVGGNTAVYTYTLPRSANLPTDFDKIQTGIAQMLKTKDIPIITVSAGELSVSMVNGVNIPVDFRQMILERNKGLKSLISGLAGVDAMGKDIEVVLGDKNPHAILFGKTGTGKTVTIMTILYSVMSAVSPDDLKIAYVDGKGNSFEFMRNDDTGSGNYHPNPFTYCQPADASGDIDYARAVIKHMEREVRRRIELFKTKGVSKLAEFNKKYPNEKLPEILMVVDEFSAILDQDKNIKQSEVSEKGTLETFEYIAKMARSVGIRMLLANQTARKEKVPGKISANITGRISLGVAEPIESDLALPESGIAVHLISQPGEFYSTMNGIRNPEHGNSPYLPDDVMYALNDSLEKKFGHREYIVSRDEILQEMDDSADVDGETSSVKYAVPTPMPDKTSSLEDVLKDIQQYPQWASSNRESKLFNSFDFLNGISRRQAKEIEVKMNNAFDKAQDVMIATQVKTRKASGDKVSTSAVMTGNKGKPLG